ncbi:hypothetical protein AMECASPLE_027348 [Ameca splendens]|uniref:Uncharacterized protein n=1 Tax=Ameca splendens TaxID=208324 RepID=A0ABV0XI52_9TELE
MGCIFSAGTEKVLRLVRKELDTGRSLKKTVKGCKRLETWAAVQLPEGLSQSPDLNPLKNLRKNLKVDFHICSLFNLTELKLVWKERASCFLYAAVTATVYK